MRVESRVPETGMDQNQCATANLHDFNWYISRRIFDDYLFDIGNSFVSSQMVLGRWPPRVARAISVHWEGVH